MRAGANGMVPPYAGALSVAPRDADALMPISACRNWAIREFSTMVSGRVTACVSPLAGVVTNRSEETADVQLASGM